jgi:ABC-2 type transport system permease protein
MLGRRTGGYLLMGYAAQLVWIAVAVAVLMLMWNRATRRYSAVGA